MNRRFTQPAPSLRSARDSVPEALDRIVIRCLARLPADRYRTAAEVRDALIAPHGGAEA